MSKSNDKALKTYCEVLITLRNMRDNNNYENAVINFIIREVIRGATDSAHPFGYSDNGKKAAQFISEDAWDQLKNGTNTDLICEHIIPISVLTGYIKEKWDKWDIEVMKECFGEYSKTAIITSDEDKKLKDSGLRENMPEGFTINDTFSRYRYVGIRLHKLVQNDAKVDGDKDRDVIISDVKRSDVLEKLKNKKVEARN